ncbi:MAG: hypothetical protein ACJAU1_000772, partial [Psychromonas sp.]
QGGALLNFTNHRQTCFYYQAFSLNNEADITELSVNRQLLF